MSTGNSGTFKSFTSPATGVKRFKETSVSDISNKVQEITAASVIDPNANSVQVTGPATSTYAVTLAAPNRGGQIMVIEMVSTTDTSSVTLALTNIGGGSAATTATFNAAAETLTLISSTTKWWVLTEEGVTLA